MHRVTRSPAPGPQAAAAAILVHQRAPTSGLAAALSVFMSAACYHESEPADACAQGQRRRMVSAKLTPGMRLALQGEL